MVSQIEQKIVEPYLQKYDASLARTMLLNVGGNVFQNHAIAECIPFKVPLVSNLTFHH